ncbi:unnamed protein product, partial [Onchocerca ochengi]|uniref:BLM10_mid domain-containing protein n=1 Tax=Onchocerca ochengi TaxID=42157 RepID=A0A182DZX7_ONCOC
MWMTDDRDDDETKTLKEKQSEKNGYIYTSAEGYLRDKPKFQRTRREYSYLPYYETINRNASCWLEQIKSGLATSTLSYVADSGLSFWMSQLSQYLNRFYCRFSKADHIKLIEFIFNIILEPDYDRRLIHKACSLIITLINTVYHFSEEIIKRSDLTLPWRPLYDLYIEVAYKRNSKNLEKSVIRSAVLACKELFPLSATKEILDEIRPFIDLWSDYAMTKFVTLFSIFVPLKLSSDEHDRWGAGLWYDELWISEYCPGYIDWSSKHTIIFSKLLRSLNLSVRYNKVAIGDGTGMGSESSGAEWIVWMLGGVNESAHQCFERLIKCVESFLHPLHEGDHMPTLQSFLDSLVNEMVRRVRIERVRKKTRNKVPSKMRLTDEQIEWFVSILLPSVLYSVFSTTETSASSIMRNLAFLAPQLVLPKCLDLVYPSLLTITEPHRLKQSLECIVEICVPLVRDNGTYSYRTYNVCKQDRKHEPASLSIVNESEIHSDRFRVPLRKHAIFLLEALIEAIDINDSQKLSLSLQANFTLETIFHLIPIVNCSRALEMEEYMNLAEEEKELCKLTARFPNIVQDFVNKVFKVITQLASSAPSDCVSYMDSICDNSDILLAGSEEIEISKSIQSAFHALFLHCSSTFVELIGDQTYKFISTSEFENVIAADAACSLIQESTYANPTRYFPMYIKFLLEKQKQHITEEKKILKELDATTMWFTYLSEMIFSVPSDLLLKYQEECIQMHKCTISMMCYNAYQGACWSLKNLLTQLIEIYPISEEDRQHNLDLPLRLSLPIKEWGINCFKDVVTIKWHIPTDAEVDFAEKLLNEFAYSEIQLLATPQNMDKFAIKRSLFVVDSLLSCVGNRLPSFNTPEIKLSETAVDMDPIHISSMSPRMKMFSINGENIREMVRVTIHNLMEFLLNQQDDQSKNLLLISSILQMLCTEGVRIASQISLKALITKFPNSKCLLMDDVLEHLDSKRNIIHEEMKGALYILNKCGFLSSNTISIRFKCWLAIVKLKVSVKPSIIKLVKRSVNSISVKQWTLERNIAGIVFPDDRKCFESVVRLASKVFNGWRFFKLRPFNFSGAQHIPSVSPLNVKILQQGYNSGTSFCSNLSILSLFARLLMPFLPQFDLQNSAKIRTIAQKMFVDNNVNKIFCAKYQELLHSQAIRMSENKFNERHEKNLHELAEICKNKQQLYHWRQVDSARTFLFTFHRILFTTEVAEVFLQMLIDVRSRWRRIAAECIASYLEWNKPLTKRILWDPPDKAILSSTKPDNLSIVYDSTRLPKDEQTWNETIFISKPYWGAYQWP